MGSALNAPFQRIWYPSAGDSMKPAQTAGFTLIEAMVVVAIISTTVITIPLLHQWLNRQGVRHAVEQLHTDLQLSRVTAIRQRQTSCVRFNTPGLNQYLIESVNRRCDLAAYRGNVHFLRQGPDGAPMTTKVSFNCQGMNTTVVPADIFLTDGGGSAIYRIEIMQPGGISVHRWSDGGWR
jgi:prepilin-type N-terminal cleavage/methylation domain-containing protein